MTSGTPSPDRRAPAARAICLAGPTASGKSAIAMALAASPATPRPVEIVSVDSALVYRGMDIGTAKPTPDERRAVPHHLIDLIDPAQAYSAARFVADTRRAVGEISARGHQPLLVGGTMLYFKALREGLDEMPPADPAVRAALEARAAEQGWPALHAELARVDPVTAARLPPGDAQRIPPGAVVQLATGRAQSPLAGTVARIEPQAFTKVSALGIEEQRVNVVVALDAKADDLQRLGDGFRVDARITLSAQDGALLVPSAALVRQGDGWQVFVAEGGKARTRTVTFKDRHADSAWVQDGLKAGDVVILYPGSAMTDGRPVRVRSAP